MPSPAVTAVPRTDAPPHLRTLQVGWAVVYGSLVLTMCAAVPTALRLNAQLNELHLPDARWTLPQLRAALATVGVSERTYALLPYVSALVVGLTFVVVAGVIVVSRPGDRSVTTISLLLAVVGWAVPGTHLSLAAVYPAWETPLRALGITAFSCLVLLLYLLPDGRFVPRWTRWPALLTVAIAPLHALDGPLDPSSWPAALDLAVVVASLGIPLAAQVHRYRTRADAVQRQQVKWVVLSVVTLLVGVIPVVAMPLLVPEVMTPGPTSLRYHAAANTWLAALTLLVPVAVGVSTLRLRLWDVDPLISRTLVYGTLTLVIGGVFAAVVGALGWLFQARGNLLVSLLAAGVVAVVFEPARRRTLRAVNRVVYGERDDPYAVVSRLGQRIVTSLAPDAVLAGITATVREAFRIPAASIQLEARDGSHLRTVTDPPGDHDAAPPEPPAGSLRVPLSFRGEVVGWLTLAPRAPGETFSPRDRHLVEELARQAAPAVFAVRATLDLQQAHERLVTAGQEERRRLRRELHDVLGPALAAMSMDLEVASALAPDDTARTTELLADVRSSLKDTLVLVRRLAYGLYPPVLDQLGLAGALREHATTHLEAQGVAVALDLPERLDSLPAAAEVAAYHIATEAMLNVRRHSGARRCRVRLAVDDGHLEVEITDDGHGLDPSARAGVGLSSMHERATELGGRCRVEPAPPSGTRVVARLPVTPEDSWTPSAP